MDSIASGLAKVPDWGFCPLCCLHPSPFTNYCCPTSYCSGGRTAFPNHARTFPRWTAETDSVGTTNSLIVALLVLYSRRHLCAHPVLTVRRRCLAASTLRGCLPLFAQALVAIFALSPPRITPIFHRSVSQPAANCETAKRNLNLTKSPSRSLLFSITRHSNFLP
jgi:hypothetical protein